MLLKTLYGEPGHLIRRCQQIAVALFMEEVGHLCVTPVQYAVLTAIADQPGLDATGLSALVAFDRATLGDVIERLERRGLLDRRPGTTDRRTKSLWLTPAGKALLDTAEPAVERTQERILAPLSETDRPYFLAMLEQMAGLRTNQGETRCDSERNARE